MLSQLNSQLSPYGISAQVGSDGQIQFGGATAFTVTAAAASAGTGVATGTRLPRNGGVYSAAGAASYTGKAESLTFQNGQQTASVALTAADTVDTAISKINAATSGLGIYAVKNAAGTGISFQSTGNFTVSTDCGRRYVYSREVHRRFLRPQRRATSPATPWLL